MRTLLIIAAIVFILLSCKKEQPLKEQPRCYECETRITKQRNDGMATTDQITKKQYCEQTFSGIKLIEAQGTFTRSEQEYLKIITVSSITICK